MENRQRLLVAAACVGLFACSAEDSTVFPETAATGGDMLTGGVLASGDVLGSGGIVATGTGGELASGGDMVTGGELASGGDMVTGGEVATGGMETGGMATGGMETGGSDEPAFMPTGDPIDSLDGEWEWVEFSNTKCRDGSPAGIAVNRSATSKKLMIYLEGGGACFQSASCAVNPVNVIAQTPASDGIFDRSNSANPVGDWNYVYVPYCTGDVHSGTRENVEIPGVNTGLLGLGGPMKNQFVGRKNLETFMERIVPTFADVDQVLVTGISAGGFGAATNYEYVQWTFGDVPVFMIDDSGPPMSNEYIQGCLFEQWSEIWGFEDGFLADCGADCTDISNLSMEYAEHTALTQRDDVKGGLIETTADGVISLFYGMGNDACPGKTVTPEQFKAGLMDFRETIKGLSDDFGTYYMEGTDHTILGQNRFYEMSVNGVSLRDWFNDIITDTAAAHVGP